MYVHPDGTIRSDLTWGRRKDDPLEYMTSAAYNKVKEYFIEQTKKITGKEWRQAELEQMERDRRRLWDDIVQKKEETLKLEAKYREVEEKIRYFVIE